MFCFKICPPAVSFESTIDITMSSFCQEENWWKIVRIIDKTSALNYKNKGNLSMQIIFKKDYMVQ